MGEHCQWREQRWLRGPDNYVRSIIGPIAPSTERFCSHSPYRSFLQFSSDSLSRQRQWPSFCTTTTGSHPATQEALFYNAVASLILCSIVPKTRVHILNHYWMSWSHYAIKKNKLEFNCLKLKSGDEKPQGRKRNDVIHPILFHPSKSLWVICI